MCLPKGQEAELAGFYVYCTQILAWLPPLIFSLLVEANVPQKYGVIATSFGFVVGIMFLSCTASWEEILAEADHNKGLDLILDEKYVAMKDEGIQGPGDGTRPNNEQDASA
jgi:Na+/melibiose symporter-like transporter